MIKRVIQALNYEIPPQFCVWAMVLWWVLCPVGLLLNCCSIFNYTSILIVSTCNILNTEDTRGFKWWDKQFSCPNIFYYIDYIYLILLSWQLLWFHQYLLNTNFCGFHCWLNQQNMIFVEVQLLIIICIVMNIIQ